MLPDIEWDNDAKAILRMAHDESDATGDNYVGTQHLLLALATFTAFKPPGCDTLQRDTILDAIENTIGFRVPGTLLISPGAQTPRAKQVIQLAAERASAEHRAVTVRDLWCGLLADPESVCSPVFRHLEIDIHALRKALSP